MRLKIVKLPELYYFIANSLELTDRVWACHLDFFSHSFSYFTILRITITKILYLQVLRYAFLFH